MWAFRALFFKLMLLSGTVKLQSRCPTWLGLTALDYHFATQCIPTPLAQLAHGTPAALRRFGVAFTLFVEGPGTLLIVLPGICRELRLVSLWAQGLLQIAIALTGNYNFFNWLTLSLALVSSADDQHIAWLLRLKLPVAVRRARSRALRVIGFLSSSVICVFLAHAWTTMFAAPGNEMRFRMGVEDYERQYAAPVAKAGALLVVLHILALPLKHAIEARPRTSGFAFRLASALAQSAVALIAVYLSLDPLARTAHPRDGHALAPLVRSAPEWIRPSSGTLDVALRTAHSHNLVSGYGLFRRMTGVGSNGEVARPEVVFEGHIPGTDDEWAEIEMRYKPGNVSKHLPFVAPHQPRVAWQMWFAALGTYQHNPWLVSLAYRLLQDASDATAEALPPAADNTELRHRLLEPGGPFAHPGGVSPDAIRAELWSYDFEEPWSGRVWKRKRVRSYLPQVTRADLGGVQEQLQLHAPTKWPRRADFDAWRGEAVWTLSICGVLGMAVGAVFAWISRSLLL